MKKRHFIWISLLTVLLLSGILLYMNIKKAVKLQNITLDATRVAHDTLEMEAHMIVNNPFFFDFSLHDIQYTLSLGNKQLLSDVISIDKKVDDSTSLTLPIVMDYKKVAEQLEKLQAQDSTLMRFAFTVGYTLPLLGTQSSSIQGTKEIPVPPLPAVSLEDIAVKNFGFKNIALDVTLKIENPSSVSVTMDNLLFNVQLNETKLAEGIKWKAVLVPARETTRFTLPIDVKTGAIAKEFFDQITQGDKIKVYLNGSSILSIKDSPLDSIQVLFETEGAMQL